MYLKVLFNAFHNVSFDDAWNFNCLHHLHSTIKFEDFFSVVVLTEKTLDDAPLGFDCACAISRYERVLGIAMI